PPGRGRRTWHERERARSGRQARAAALASGLQHRPTAPASHAGPEAVALLALSVVRLERALHAWPPREGSPARPEVGGRKQSGEPLSVRRRVKEPQRGGRDPPRNAERPLFAAKPRCYVRTSRQRHGLGGELPRTREAESFLSLTATSGGPKRNVLHTCGCTCGI